MKLLNKIVKGLATAALLATGWVQAALVDIYVDAAPNVFGSPNYAPWASNARSSAANGTFVNMANSANPANAGSTNFQLEDMVVYSFGDLGRRLSWVYFVPNETIASLTGRIQIALSYDWDGVTYDAYDDLYGATWISPTMANLVEIDGGVVGIAGWAWWGAFGVNTQAALDADLAAWRPYQGDLTFQVRLLDDAGVVEGGAALTVQHNNDVPEPGTLLLAGLALLAASRLRRRR